MTIERSPGAAAPADPEPPEGEGRESPPPRSLLGRLFGAFSGEVDPEIAAQDARGAPVIPGLANLRRLRVDDIAIPKADIVAAPVDISESELVSLFQEHGFTRIPVYRETLDSPLGLVHLKDMALTYGFGADAPPFALEPMLRPLLYAPPSMPLDVLLHQMQQKRLHMALVIDEYGGVDGLVTIEDLIEQVVGEIEDEHDEIEGDLWQPISPGVWDIEARAPLIDVETVTGLRLATDEEEEDVDTLGGLIVMAAGRVLQQGETIRLANGAEIEVLDADPRRIGRVRLSLPAPDATG